MPRDSYLHPAAIELAALATFIRAGHIRDDDLRSSRLFTVVSIIYTPVQQGYIDAIRPIVLDLAAAMDSRKFIGCRLVKENADNYVDAIVSGKLTADAIRKVIVDHAHRPPS